MLWIIPEDMFRSLGARLLCDNVRQSFACDAWLLSNGTACAFSPRGLLTKAGVAIDYDAELAITRPLFTHLAPYVVPDGDCTILQIPGSRYFVTMFLRPGESDTRYCRYIKSRLVAPNPCAVKAYASYTLTDSAREMLRNYLSQWLTKYSVLELHGERLRFAKMEIRDFHQPESRTFSVQDGFEILFPDYEPVMWPWIELYLHMRKTLPRRQRLSLEFYNPDE